MKWFGKKKETEFKLPEVKHLHTWKDMPWYMETGYNGSNKTASYMIIEPYICISCGERKNVTLERQDWSNISAEEREKIYSKVRNKYRKYLKPRAVVEDMINNILLVQDAHKLEMLETMRGLPYRGVGTSSEQQPENEFQIHLENVKR